MGRAMRGLAAWLIAGVGAVALSACATASLEAPPASSTASAKSAEALRDCYVTAGPRLLVAPYRDGWRLSLPDLYAMFILVRPQGAGSVVEVYGSDWAARSAKSLVAKCA